MRPVPCPRFCKYLTPIPTVQPQVNRLDTRSEVAPTTLLVELISRPLELPGTHVGRAYPHSGPATVLQVASNTP